MKTQFFNHKSQAALSTLCWGLYMILNGISLIVHPNGGLTAMGFEPTEEVCIRMAGLLALVLGFYYLQMGRYNFTPFYTWKLTGHAGGILIMTLLYQQGLAPSTIFIFCLSDALAAHWTAWGIYYDRKQALHAVARTD
jgi:hypothetical protein